MTNFEKITASPAALAEFLGSLPVLDGPWDDDFHREFCDDCQAENCDAENCPHQAERNNPARWLGLETKETLAIRQQVSELRKTAYYQLEVLANFELGHQLRRAADAMEALLNEKNKTGGGAAV